MKILVTNGFINYGEDRLITKGRYIWDQLTENASIFVSPVPSLTDLASMTNDLEKAYLSAQSRDRIKLAQLADKKLKFVSFLQQLGIYVNLVADGDRTIALLSGFDVRKLSEPRVCTLPIRPGFCAVRLRVSYSVAVVFRRL